ncbi:hypothetical protein HZS_2517 [Henneguya salminicola]|nr:hypothetical protein HZS_2517 [Henneguya salminicola]
MFQLFTKNPNKYFKLFSKKRVVSTLEYEFLEGKNFINNEFVKPVEGRTYNTRNPLNGIKIGKYADSTGDDAALAIAAASHAFVKWKTLSFDRRSCFLLELSEKFFKHKEQLALCITIEMGKPISESIAEVNNSINLLKWYADSIKRISGPIIDPGNNKKLFVLHKPHGVVGLITPVTGIFSMI